MAVSRSFHVRKGGITDIENGRLEAGREGLKAEFIRLRAKGYSYRKIADRISVSKSTLANWSHELEGEITSARAMELEALQEQYHLLKEGRIKLLGGLLERLREEAEARDLSSLPTEKVFDLVLKYEEAVKAECVEVRPLSETQMAGLREVDRTDTKLDSRDVVRGLTATLMRYQAGLVDDDRAKRELAVLLALLKAEEQAVLKEKLERIQAVLEERRK